MDHTSGRDRHFPALTLTLFFGWLPGASYAAPSQELSDLFGSAATVSLTTGYERPLRGAPGTATVITRTDIEVSGMRTLRDVLESVPGFHISTSDGRSTVATVRGITSRILILVDNVPITRTYIDPWTTYDNILLHNVERIEVICGPGSALYGADTVAGSVNILTRTGNADGVDPEVGVAIGSFDTVDAWSVGSIDLDRLAVKGSITYSTTEGSDKLITADAQSAYDRALGTAASHAPGEIQQRRDLFDASVDATLGSWRLHLNYFDQNPLKNGVGIAQALDLDGEWNSLYQAAQLEYRNTHGAWSLLAYIDWSTVRQESWINLFPAGAFRSFPDGVISSFRIDNDRLRAESTVVYRGFEHHILSVGLGALDNDYDTVKDDRNFIVRANRFIYTGPVAPLAGVNDDPLTPDISHTVLYAYLQDEWQFGRDWSLTTGLRADEYSDMGTAFNPRVGLVWNARHDLTAKLLYSRAFRPPSLLEQHSSGVFSPKGNVDLEPTTLDMVELAASYSRGGIDTDVSVFRYRQNKLIQIIPNPTSPNGVGYINGGQVNGWGAEASLKWPVATNLLLTSNYSYQTQIGDEAINNANNRFAPEHMFFAQARWSFAPDWSVSVMGKWIAERHRAHADPRLDPDDYTLVDAALRRERLFQALDLSLIVRNALDSDAHDASGSAAALPYDIPLPGRSVMLEAAVAW